MIQAIVFLPLIGAILAGLIAVFAAQARTPSGDTVEHHDDAHGHGAVPVNEDAGVIHASHHQPDAHGDHGHDDHAVEPPAAGSRAAELITTGLLLVSAGLCSVAQWGGWFPHHCVPID